MPAPIPVVAQSVHHTNDRSTHQQQRLAHPLAPLLTHRERDLALETLLRPGSPRHQGVTLGFDPARNVSSRRASSPVTFNHHDKGRDMITHRIRGGLGALLILVAFGVGTALPASAL